MRQWISKDKVTIFSWAFDPNAQPSRITKIPFSHKYFQMARADCDHQLDNEMATALTPETDLDRQELTSWLNDLLHEKHIRVR